MVQNAHDGWPTLSNRGAELFREAVRTALAPQSGVLAAIHEAALSGERMRTVAADPVLAEGIRQTTTANLLHWASANVEHPGERVVPVLGPTALATARDLVRRGMDRDALDSYRTSQEAVWRLWLPICFDLSDEPTELRELLVVSSRSIATFIDDTISAISARMEAERDDLTSGTPAERRATVTLVLEGAPVDRPRAEGRLGYRFDGAHTAAIVWAPPGTAPRDLEAAAEALMHASGAARRLTVVASAATLWLWLPGPAPSGLDAQRAIASCPGVRVAIGRTATGLDGFRRSHLDAAAAQRTLAALSPGRRLAFFADIQLVDLLRDKPSDAAEFIADTLGALAHAERELREIVLAYVREQCNTSRTAERLYTHRNTVLRRLARADELLPRPLADNVVHVGVALELLSWQIDPA
ncbi:PucR family transcriptional regulator [Tsukamurella soli]